jgi:hypothetical protein
VQFHLDSTHDKIGGDREERNINSRNDRLTSKKISVISCVSNSEDKVKALGKEILGGYNVHYLVDLSDFIIDDDDDKFNNNGKNSNSDSNRLEIVRHILFNMMKLYRQLQRQFQQL